MTKKAKNISIGIELINDPTWMGGTLYLRNLAVCLARLPESERPMLRLLGAPDVVSAFVAEWGHLSAFEYRAESVWDRILGRLGMSVKSSETPDVVYPGFGASVAGAATIRWIPDFQHRYLPHLFSANEIAARDRSIGEVAERPGVVVFSSESAAGDFRRFYPQHNATPRVWHFHSLLDTTVAASRATLEKYQLPEKYLYLPNQFWVHKNHITAFKALARLRDDYGLVVPLVCTGAQADRRNEEHFSALMQFIESHKLTAHVHLLGLLERSEQIDVLRHSAAVVQPSMFEGWSTVVEDVRATGRPIFLSDIPVHREQHPENSFYFPAESDTQLAESIAQQWGKFSAGPDFVSESNARLQVEDLILNSARVFCAIARTALTEPCD